MREDFEPVRRQVELLHDPAAQERQRVRARGCAHARPQLLGDTGAADDVAPLEDLDRQPRGGEVGRGDEAVVACAYDYRVRHAAIRSWGSGPSRRAILPDARA